MATIQQTQKPTMEFFPSSQLLLIMSELQLISVVCHQLLVPNVLHSSQGLADSAVMAIVNGQGWDLDRPLEADAELKLVKFDDPEGTRVE